MLTLTCCGFIILFSSIYIQMKLNLYYVPCACVCMSRECKVSKGQRVSHKLVKVYEQHKAALESYFSLRRRGGRLGGCKWGQKKIVRAF